MAVSSSYAPLTYAWTNTDQAFPVTWPFFSGSLRVVHIDTDGDETIKTLSTHYTVSGGTDSDGLPATGTVTMIGSSGGGTIRIERVTPKTQSTTWTENDDFPAKVMEAALDRLVMIAQELVDGGLDFVGAWATATDYEAGDVVQHDGSSYIAIAEHTSASASEPGTGADWDDYWALLASGGTSGVDGVSPTWIAQSGAPDNADDGVNGDMYLNTNNGDVYGPKANGAWGSVIANITGPAGAGTGDMLKSENLSGLADYATARANMGLTIGTHVQAYHALLQSISGLTFGSDSFIYGTGSNTAAAGTITSFGRSLVDDADAGTARTTLGLGNTATMNEASVSEYRSATADRPISPDTAWSAADLVSLTDGTTIAVNMSNGFNFTVTLGGNRTLGNPTNAKPGQTGIIEINQDGTGSRTLAYGGNWKFAGGTAPTLTTTAGAKDVLSYVVLSSTSILATLIADVQ